MRLRKKVHRLNFSFLKFIDQFATNTKVQEPTVSLNLLIELTDGVVGVTLIILDSIYEEMNASTSRSFCGENRKLYAQNTLYFSNKRNLLEREISTFANGW